MQRDLCIGREEIEPGERRKILKKFNIMKRKRKGLKLNVQDYTGEERRDD